MANAKGLTMHIHAMGNMAVNRAVNAYVNGGKNELRNTIVHLRNVNQPDYKRMADHNIFLTNSPRLKPADSAIINQSLKREVLQGLLQWSLPQPYFLYSNKST